MSLLRRIFVLVLSVGLVAAVPPASDDAPAVATAEVETEPRLGARVPATMAEGTGLIRLMAGAFDPTRSLAPVPGSIPLVDPATIRPDAATYWLAQVAGDALVGARAAIDDAGAVVEGVVPDATYVMRATAVQAAAVAGSDDVRAVVLYQPGWKVPVALGEYEALLDVEGPQRYHVHLWDSAPDPVAARAAVGAIDGARLLDATDRVLTVGATRAQVPAIAAVSDVAWIELEPTVVPLNAQARWVNDTAVRDLPNVMTDQRLDGTGQTAGVADTGVNYVPDRNGNAHVSFRDCSGGTVHEPTGCREADYVQAQPGTSADAMNETVATGERHRKMAAYFDLGATGPNPSDLSAHGTHVAGSVNGDHGTYGTWDGEDGMAPAARLVHQNIGSPGGGLASPSDSYQLWRQAYRPRDPASVESRPASPITYAQATGAYRPDEDARTHNNSYGLIVPSVSLGSAEAADRFVWEHEDMVIVSSAGNSGPVPLSIGAPSLGKNVISSAASANGRQPMASIDSIASFSSHGPTGDGRLGVDLATPGQTVISAKGGTNDEFHYLQGTSMSGPVLTGFATLVRQYFWDGYGPGTGAANATASGFAEGTPDVARRHNPSAALVRAALVNGATRMEGWYSGDDGSQREMDGQYPSAGQGFGLVNLTESLFFDDAQGRSTRNAWYTDVWRAAPDAFGIGTGGIREYEIDVAPGEPLSVTLTYTDAPSQPALGTPYLVNDLDLVVEAPDGTLYSGNNFNTRAQPKAEQAATLPGVVPDQKNPVERVLIPAPVAGPWTVRVVGTEVALGPQGFALAATGLIDEADGTPTFVPGAELQTDAPGSPAVAGVTVETVDHNIARVTWTTSEPTTGAVELRGVSGAGRTFTDVYNHDGPSRGNDGDPGYDGLEEGPVETSEDYANKPVVNTDHEVLVTGLEAGERYDLVVRSTDLGGNTTRAPSRSYTATDAIFGAQAFDMAQLVEAPTDAVATFDPILGIGDGAFGLGTQLYAGESNGGLLGAFMFRLPEHVDPSRITGAAVELTSMHDLTNHYESDIVTYVDLLPEVYEEDWQANNYETIHNAPSVARTLPETGYRRGGQKTYPFSFTCTDLDQLKGSLSTVQEGERRAAFRFDAETDIPGLFSHEFGFNRRSRGADLRPRLVLFLDGRDPSGCDTSAPAPTIVDVGIQEALAGETDDDGNDVTRAVTVSWQTDVPSDSTVLFREQGSDAEPTAVSHPSLTTTHGVTVLGLDPAKTYEFAVASANCAGRVTVDDNADRGYLLYPPEFPTVEDLEPDQFTTFFFHGTPTDEAQKTAGLGGPTTATFSTEPPDGEPGFQQTTALANTSFVENPLAAYWTGPVDGPFELHGPLLFEWYWGGSAPRETTVDIVVFADPDRSAGASVVQPERIVASGTVPITVTTGPIPSEVSVGAIPVRDGSVTVQDELVIQVTGGGLEDDDLVVHYDTAETPSRFRVPTVQLAQPPAEMPDAGPVPPDPSDGFAAAPPQQQGTPTAAARAAGTARCGTVTRTTDAPEGSGGTGGTGGGSGGSDTGEPGRPAGDGERADERGRGPDSACDHRHVPATPFEDTSGSVHEASIRCIAWYQITRGVGDRDGDGREEYAPLGRVNRAQMASFVAMLAVEAGIDLDEDAPDAFSDDDGSVHEPAIDALAAAGLVEGVDDERFEPAAKVTRAQMASFIARVHMAATGTRQEPQRDHFEDDDGTHHERNINILADLGVVRGVGDTDGDGRNEYRPGAAVTRAQMASFIASDLDLLAAAGRAHPGGAEVFLRTTRAAPGEEVTGQVRSHKSIRALRAEGCGIDDARLSVADDGTFTVRIPEDQEEGTCELALAVTTQRGFQPGDGQDVVYRFTMTIEAPS